MTDISFDTRYSADLAQIFSCAAIKAIAAGQKSRVVSVLARRAGAGLSQTTSLADFYRAAYSHLFHHYRAEYVYKNAIARQLLLARHSTDEAQLFTEFRAENSKADVVIANGTTTAYEIKTELDSFTRLSSQLSDYCRIFDRVYVLTHGSRVREAMFLAPTHVGVLELTRHGEISEQRPAASNIGRLRQRSIFASLRRGEYLRIIEDALGYRPTAPSGMIYSVAAELFDGLTAEQAMTGMAGALRARRLPTAVRQAVDASPDELSCALLAAKLKPIEASRLAVNLSLPVCATA